MNIKLYSIYDSVANEFGIPFAASSDGVAVRSVHAETKNPAAGPLHTHASDFKIFRLGSFDNETGKVDLFPQPVFLTVAGMVLEQGE